MKNREIRYFLGIRGPFEGMARWARDMKAESEECVAPPGLCGFLFIVPGLTLRLRSGQAPWASFCRSSGALNGRRVAWATCPLRSSCAAQASISPAFTGSCCVSVFTDWPEGQSNGYGEYRTCRASKRTTQRGLLQSTQSSPPGKATI
jgi:hypothetical protein